MRKSLLVVALIALPMTLSACGGSGDGSDSAPGGVSADQARTLNDAAAMLDANSVSANAVGIEPETNS
ncbi:hypothetical protein GCM10023219_11810 [Stakelama sediminis]|uniref:Putative small secreted protein n=1 Tax=Stakelama sediminis TaxID=463200 RepID=A0A840YWG3_9SPHN|nr:hypothetical protein [Stakelama sediminis]MBB5717905.1 putative small secreted protein [Stakelama sediminis]